MKYLLFLVVITTCYLGFAAAQYDDVRCICNCPGIPNIAPSKCNCTNSGLPSIGGDIKDKDREFCSRCECKYQSRNTTTIKVVVIIVIWIISLLVIYMLFLVCLDPLLNKKTTQYQEQTNEEEEGGANAQPLRVSGTGVLNRVSHTQDKWKRQVQEQRRHIYDRHTILN